MAQVNMKSNIGGMPTKPKYLEVRRCDGRQTTVHGCTSNAASAARSRMAVAAPSSPRQDDVCQALAAACLDPLDDQDPPLHPCVIGLAYRDGACGDFPLIVLVFSLGARHASLVSWSANFWWYCPEW